MTDLTPEPPVRYPSPSEVRERCLIHNLIHTLGTGCEGCMDDHLRYEAEFYEGYTHHRGEL